MDKKHEEHLNNIISQCLINILLSDDKKDKIVLTETEFQKYNRPYTVEVNPISQEITIRLSTREIVAEEADKALEKIGKGEQINEAEKSAIRIMARWELQTLGPTGDLIMSIIEDLEQTIQEKTHNSDEDICDFNKGQFN